MDVDAKTMVERVLLAIKKAGGQEKLAPILGFRDNSGVSRFARINGPPQFIKLLKVAELSGWDVRWILTGKGDSASSNHAEATNRHRVPAVDKARHPDDIDVNLLTQILMIAGESVLWRQLPLDEKVARLARTYLIKSKERTRKLDKARILRALERPAA